MGVDPADYLAKHVSNNRPHRGENSDPGGGHARNGFGRCPFFAHLMLAAKAARDRRVAAALALGTEVEARALITRHRLARGTTGGWPTHLAVSAFEIRARIGLGIRIERPPTRLAARKIINGYEPFHCAVRLASLESNFVS
jgi:hypothetical protein